MPITPILQPDVFVEQVFRRNAPTLASPDLPTVIVGINKQIEVKQLAGAYANLATDYAYPNLIAGSVVEQAGVRAYIQNSFGTFEITLGTDFTVDADSVNLAVNIPITRTLISSSSTGETSDSTTLISLLVDGVTTAATNIFTSATAAFVLGDVGRKLYITPRKAGVAQTDAGVYVIIGFTSVTTVTVSTITGGAVSFTGAVTLEFYKAADYSSFVDDLADYLGSGVVAGSVVAISSGSDSGSYRNEHTVSDIELQLNMVKKDPSGVGSIAVGTTFTDASVNFTTLGIRAGDSLVIIDTPTGVDQGVFTVTAVGTTTLTVSPAFTSVQITVSYKIVRNLATATSVPYSITLTTRNNSGNVLVSYIAVRNDHINEFQTIESSDDAETKLGPPIPANPLGFAVFLALQNTDTVVHAMQISEDGIDDHVSASEALEAQEVYAIVPLTQDPANHQVWAAHVAQQSEAESKHERIVLINRAIFIQETKVTETAAGDTNITGLIFTDTTTPGTFITDGVVAGDHVVVTVLGVESSARILTVDSETQVTLVSALPISLVGVDYRIDSDPLDKTEQATFIAEYSQAFLNRRVINVWPDEVEVTYDDDTDATITTQNVTAFVAGYFGAAIVGGQICGLPPEQPLTNVPMTGLTGLRKSNTYFSPTQLNIMAGGGTYIIAQDVDTAPCFARHQLTTDTTTIESREVSIVKAVDFTAKFVRRSAKPYVGRYNVTKIFLEQLATVLDGVGEKLKADGHLSDYRVREVLQSASQPDTVLVTIDILVLYPANFIRITLVI